MPLATSSVLAPRKFLDDHHEAGTVLYDCVTDHWRMTFNDCGNVAQMKRLSIAIAKYDLGEVRFRGNRQHVPDVQPLTGGVYKPAGAGC